LTADVPQAPIEVWADPAKLRQVLLNLLSNAVKFTEPGGAITVAAGIAAESSAFMRVADTGIGMSDDDIPTALAPFGQVDNRLSRRYEGTGLGLPLSKAIVELHGGQITINSKPGCGTAVTVSLPLAVDAMGAAA
jgi:signal transduction histidine kinase